MTEKSQVSPAVAIVGLDEDDLATQEFRDWRLVSRELPCDFAPFATTPGRYMLIVLEPTAFAIRLRANRRLLLSLLVDTELRCLSVNLVTVGNTDIGADRCVVAVVASSMLVLDHPGCPSSGGFSLDLVRHLRSITSRSEVGETHIDNKVCSGTTVSQVLGHGPSCQGQYAVPPKWRDATELSRLRTAIRAKPESDARPVTFRVNDFYGHSRVLQDYCGAGNLPIHGQVQHGWTLPGYHPVVGMDYSADTALLWSPQAVRNEYQHIEVIGSPYLYLSKTFDLGAVWPDGLLAIPSHGIAQHPIRGGWDEYAEWLRCLADERCLSPVSVCLHPHDGTAAAVVAFESRGICPVSCGSTLDSSYLHRIRSFIRQHGHVTTNRVSTPAFYALYEGRQLAMGGPIMGTEPPDRGEELAGDSVWTHKEYPALFGTDVVAAQQLARAELGADYIKSPTELRQILFGWYYGKQA